MNVTAKQACKDACDVIVEFSKHAEDDEEERGQLTVEVWTHSVKQHHQVFKVCNCM